MDNNIDPKDLEKYQDNYDEKSFNEKLGSSAKKAGKGIIAKVLLLYYAMDNMTLGEKAMVYGALGYFILPIDLIPDVTPVVGFADDLAAVGYVFASVKGHIDSTARKKAADKMQQLFGKMTDAELRDLDLK